MIWHVVSMADKVQWFCTVIPASYCCARVVCHMGLPAKSPLTAIIPTWKYEMLMKC